MLVMEPDLPDSEMLFSRVCTPGLLYTRSPTLGFGVAPPKMGFGGNVPKIQGFEGSAPKKWGFGGESPMKIFGMFVGQQFCRPMVLG